MKTYCRDGIQQDFSTTMDADFKERLENQAFMATVVRTIGPGISVAEWIDFLVKHVNGYIGDVVFGLESEPWRVVFAVDDDPDAGLNSGSDIPVKVSAALSARLCEIHEPDASVTIGEIIELFRSRYVAGGVVECSVTGEGISLDFARGRHMVSSGRHLLALFVHGLTVTGTYFDPRATVVSVYPEGICEMVDGSKRPFSAVAEPEKNFDVDLSIDVPKR